MTDFEFIFSLFGLLLGLSLAEVLGGLAGAIEARLRPQTAFRIGWLSPLLATFVVLDLLSFWQAAWTSREVVAVSGRSLMAITAFAGAYYLAARLVFPRDMDGLKHLDDHFFRVRRIVIGVMFLLLVYQLGWYSSIPALAARLANPIALALTVVLILLMIAAMVAKGERWARIAMTALVARYVIVYLV